MHAPRASPPRVWTFQVDSIHRRCTMYATIRTYEQPEMADALASRRKDVEEVIRNVRGVVGYYLLKTPNGAVSVTVCDSQAGTDESTKVAGEWIRKNLPHLANTPPRIQSGEVLVTVSSSITSKV